MRRYMHITCQRRYRIVTCVSVVYQIQSRHYFNKGNIMTKENVYDHIDNRLDFLSKEGWVKMILSYLNSKDLHDMLDANELSPRFFEED